MSSKLVAFPVEVLLCPLVGRVNPSNATPATLKAASDNTRDVPGDHDRDLYFGNLIECIIDRKMGRDELGFDAQTWNRGDEGTPSLFDCFQSGGKPTFLTQSFSQLSVQAESKRLSSGIEISDLENLSGQEGGLAPALLR